MNRMIEKHILVALDLTLQSGQHPWTSLPQIPLDPPDEKGRQGGEDKRQ